MSATNGSDRVTNKQLYEELRSLRDEFPTRREMRLTVALAVVGGSSAGSVLAAVFSHVGPAAQAAAALHLAASLF